MVGCINWVWNLLSIFRFNEVKYYSNCYIIKYNCIDFKDFGNYKSDIWTLFLILVNKAYSSWEIRLCPASVGHIHWSKKTDWTIRSVWTKTKVWIKKLNLNSHQVTKRFPHGGRHLQKIYGGFWRSMDP